MAHRDLTLILMRHGEAEPHGPHASSDHARSLTARGARELKGVSLKLVHFLDRAGASNISVAVSDAVRTRQTFQQVLTANPHLHPHFFSEIYTANHPNDLRLTIAKMALDETSTILLIGHNPTISMFATELTGDFESFAPGDCMILRMSADSWNIALDSTGAWSVLLNVYAASQHLE